MTSKYIYMLTLVNGFHWFVVVIHTHIHTGVKVHTVVKVILKSRMMCQYSYDSFCLNFYLSKT